MAPPLLTLTNIDLTLGGAPLFESVELSVGMGDKIALVGRNGSGKSTLLKIAAGEIEPDSGTRFVQPGATIRYLPQEPDLNGYKNLLDYVVTGLGPGQDEYRATYLLGELGLDPEMSTANLSGGEARRGALARALAPEPDILLLDEPTNHLDLPAIEWLENEVAGLKSALIIISHDRRFLDDLTRATLWLDRGAARRLDKGFGAFENWRDAFLAEEERDAHKLDRRIVAEEHWLRYGVSGRRKRNVKRLDRLASLRTERQDRRLGPGSVKLAVSSARASGQIVVDTDKLCKSFDGRPVVADFSTRIVRGDRVGIVGPNGAGKTTLLRLLTGELAPDSGDVRLGTGLKIAHLDQKRASLDPAVSLRDTLTGGGADMVEVNGSVRHVIAYMKDFLFTPDQAGTPVGRLSGGERARVTLARALALPSNFLILDEPTNDLDLETLDLLQEMVADYPGTVIVVSHDRDFLDRVATSIIATPGEGRWIEYAGGYTDMVAQRAKSEPDQKAAARPTKAATRANKKDSTPRAALKPASRQKLSFKQTHALKTLPAQIEKLTEQVAQLTSALADPALYVRDPEKFAKISQELASSETQLNAAEEQWLELEMLREEIEAN